MKTLIRNSIYQGKNLFRDFGFLFWSLLYPIILITFFYTAFTGISNMEYEDVSIGIEKNNPIFHALETIDMVNVEEVSKVDVNKKLEEGIIHGFIDENLNIRVSDSGINQTIIRSIVDQIKQMNALKRPMEDFDFTVKYIYEEEQKANGILVIFYAMIAMVSTYSIFAGIETVSQAQGNLTNLGARLNVTPLKKGNFLLVGTIIGIVLNILANILLILFTEFVLKMDLFTEIKYSFIFIILGNLFGISLGLFIGGSNKRSIGVKTMISIGTMLFLSFLAGLMSPNVKIMLDRKFPILGQINPVSIISSNLYRINLLGNTKNIGIDMLILIGYSIILFFTSYLFLRRRNYDSI